MLFSMPHAHTHLEVGILEGASADGTPAGKTSLRQAYLEFSGLKSFDEQPGHADDTQISQCVVLTDGCQYVCMQRPTCFLNQHSY